MNNTYGSWIAGGVAARAAALIEGQETTPRSPGRIMPDGRVALCAGAALAVAGLEAQGKTKESGDLRDRIARSGSSEDIRRVFVEQNWPLDLCDSMMILNDSLRPEERTQGILKRLDALRTASAPETRETDSPAA